MNNFKTLKIEKKDTILQVFLNRPEKRNAMNEEMIHELLSVIDTTAKDEKIRLMMLAGAGEHFCAGADLTWMQKAQKNSNEENIQDAKQLAEVFFKLYHFPKPTIALIQGGAMGGGLGLTACCDIAVASENAVFCFSEAKIGLTPSMISPYVIAAIGERVARYYFLTAEKFDSLEAKRIHLVQHIVSEEKLMQSGWMIAENLLKNSPNALREAKKLIAHVAHSELSEKIIYYTVEHLAMMRTTDDAKEGLQAFLEKRNPKWE